MRKWLAVDCLCGRTTPSVVGMEHATLTYTPQFYEQAYFNELWLLASPGGKLPLSEERARQFLAKSGLKQQIVEQVSEFGIRP